MTTHSTHSITARHTFEAAHRLPHLGGKCRNLHGHSWRVEVTVSAPALTAKGTVVEYGEFKRAMREWIDTHLDHGTMLGCYDALLIPLRAEGTKLFVFGQAWPEQRTVHDWPTVEAVAALLAREAASWLASCGDVADGAHISAVRVRETSVNGAGWAAA